MLKSNLEDSKFKSLFQFKNLNENNDKEKKTESVVVVSLTMKQTPKQL